MSFRRLPFQFSTTDPAERQRELERRFGLHSSRNMFVDTAHPLSSDIPSKESSMNSSSPRLQHRVPIFVEGCNQPIHSSVDAAGANSENTKKSNVRIIPIEIEGTESKPASTRHRTFSGPPGIPNEENRVYGSRIFDTSSLKHSMGDLSKPIKKVTMEPRVHNIPIQVEGDKKFKGSKLGKAKSPKKDSKNNGSAVPKEKVKSPEKENKIKQQITKQQNVDKDTVEIENSLKKIEFVLEEFKTYEAEIHGFSGTSKDKQYRYLDEMLTRCMLKLDDVDTLGNENVRAVRKNAIKKIQESIDLLESKANIKSRDSLVSENETSEFQDMGKIQTSEEIMGENKVKLIEDQGVQVEGEQKMVPKTEATNEVEMVDINEDSLSKNMNTENHELEMHEAEKMEVLQNTIPDTEMVEINEVCSPEHKIAENHEIKMTDTTNESNDNSSIITKEPEAEITDIGLPNDNVLQDVIQNKEQNTLNIEGHVIEKGTVNCISSQPAGKFDSNISIETNNSLEDIADKSLSDTAFVTNSNVETYQNSLCDNDFKNVQ